MSPVLYVIFLLWETSSANETRASHNTLLPVEITGCGKNRRTFQELSIWEYAEDELYSASERFYGQIYAYA